MNEQKEEYKASSSLLKKNVALNTIFRILMIVAPFITAPYVSRILLSDGVGIYGYTQSLVTYFTMFAALGTVSYGTKSIKLFAISFLFVYNTIAKRKSDNYDYFSSRNRICWIK